MDRYKFLEKDRQRKQGGSVAFSVKEQLRYVEIFNGMNDSLFDNFQDRMGGESSKGDTMVRVCYRPPIQGEGKEEAFFKQVEEVAGSQTLVLMGIFNLPDILWKCNKVGCMQSRRFLEGTRDDFLIQDEPTKSDTQLDLLFTSKQELFFSVVINGIFGCSYHEVVEFKILR